MEIMTILIASIESDARHTSEKNWLHDLPHSVGKDASGDFKNRWTNGVHDYLMD